MGRNIIEVLIQADDKASGTIRGVGTSVGGLNTKMINIAAAFSLFSQVGSAVSGTLKRLVSDTIAWASALNEMSMAYGIGVENLSRLEYAAKLSGVELGDLGIAFRTLINQAQAQAQATDSSSNALTKLGISGSDANGRIKSLQILLAEVVTKLGSQGSASDKAALATDLFGRSGARMVEIFGQGPEVLAAVTREADRLGVTLSTDVVKALDDTGDAWDRFTMAHKGYWGRLISDMGATGQGIADLGARWIGMVNRIHDWITNAPKPEPLSLVPPVDVFEEQVALYRQQNERLAREAEAAKELIAAALTAQQKREQAIFEDARAKHNQRIWAMDEKLAAERVQLAKRTAAAFAAAYFESQTTVEQPELVNPMAETQAAAFHSLDVTALEVSQNISRNFSSAFTGIIMGSQSAAEAFRAFWFNSIGSVISRMFEMAILKSVGSFIPFFNVGGEIPKAQRGLEIIGGYSGRDTVPALVSRGEVVAPSPTVERLNAFLDGAERGRGGMTVNLAPLFFSGSRNEAILAADFVRRRLNYQSRFVVEGTL